MASRRILAIDQGTTNTKVLVLDESARSWRARRSPVEISCPQPGWVEQDATALWHSVAAAVDACLTSTDAQPIDAVAVTNQRESVVALGSPDRTSGRPVIIWQCRRTAAFCAELRRAASAA